MFYPELTFPGINLWNVWPSKWMNEVNLELEDKIIVHIDAPHFNAGCILLKKNERVIQAAPIIKYMFNWELDRIKSYCNKKGWKYEVEHC